MKTNMGNFDRAIRVIIALVLGALFFTKIITGTFGIIALVVSVIFVITGVAGFCPLYTLLGFSSKKK